MPCDLRSGDPDADDPLRGVDWSDDRTVRAEILYALCSRGRPDWPVHAKGVQLAGVKIAGALDFESAILPVPLRLQGCFMAEPVNLDDARTRTIDLEGCRIPSLNARGLAVSGDLNLKRLRSSDGINLINGNVSGDLACTGARIENPNGAALNADRMQIGGGVFLNGSFRAQGGGPAFRRDNPRSAPLPGRFVRKCQWKCVQRRRDARRRGCVS